MMAAVYILGNCHKTVSVRTTQRWECMPTSAALHCLPGVHRWCG